MAKKYLFILMVLAVAGSVNAQVLEEIIVTAQKREQNLQDVGISITAFGWEQLQELNLNNSNELVYLIYHVS